MSDSVVNSHIQDCFVFLSITDTDFLRMVRGSIKEKYFSSEITENIIKLCYSYLDQFGEAPKNHLHDELVRFVQGKDHDKIAQYHTYLERIQEMDVPNKEYIISRINKFIQAREFETATVEFVRLIEKGLFSEGKELMQRALRVGIVKEEVGIKYLEEISPAYYGEGGEGPRDIVIPTGFEILDNSIKGFHRKELVCIFAGYKVGKTWAGVHFGVQGLLHGRKVLHISHEETAENLDMRYDMNIGSLVSSQNAEDVTFTEHDEEGHPIDTYELERRSVYELSAIKTLRRKVARFGGELIIKKYPMGSCTIGELERYLDYLETYERFIPDVIINDYVEKMKMPLGENSQQRDRINQAYIDHKRIADERNIVVITASQIKGQSLEKKIVSQRESAAEDMRKLGNVDVGLLFSQTRAQEQSNRMQVYVLVNRSGQQSFGCVVSKNLKVGQLVLDSWRLKVQEGED